MSMNNPQLQMAVDPWAEITLRPDGFRHQVLFCTRSEDAAFLRRVIAWPKTPRSLCLAAQCRLDELERAR